MSSDAERAWRPLIYRAWNRREGHFVWTVTAPRANAWTGSTLSSARALEREARQFAMHLNAMARQQRAMEAINA